MSNPHRTKQEVKEDVIRFSIESRLLQELGERLVSSPDVAISELIKNAYDADSPLCDINYEADQHITIVDKGHGMTFDSFKKRWMSIATSLKTVEQTSPKYGRALTGAKGVGRFAVRVLGRHLKLTTIAYDKQLGINTKIVATFDWDKLDETNDLLALEIPYIYTYPTKGSIGTCIRITKLSNVLDEEVFRNLRTNVLNIASPITALKPASFTFGEPKKQLKGSVEEDPGFEILFNGKGEAEAGPAESVLSNYVGRAIVKLENNRLELTTQFKGHPSVRKKYKYNADLQSPIYADIRYFPRRSGVFKDIGVDGRTAWGWVRDNHGISIFDKGFRVPPYGQDKDDWLMLDRDNAHKKRKWRSSLSTKYIPISAEVYSDTARNPMVNLITNYQLVGAVFLHSKSYKKTSPKNQGILIPSMDRQGFVDNIAFDCLFDVIRFAVEFLCNEDKNIQLEQAEKDRLRLHQELQRELKAAITSIENSTSLSLSDKTRIIGQYEYFYTTIKDLEEYDRRAREGMDMMGFLGVVAGFMTHEHESALWELEEVTKLFDKYAEHDAEFKIVADKIRSNIQSLSEHVEYTRLFIRGIHNPVKTNLKAKPRITHALTPLRRFAEERHYNIQIQSDEGVLMPAVPIPMYEGIVLNLFSNALKALVAKPKEKEPTIMICAWSDSRNHYLTVSDNGVGIPEASQKRVWDPLFTTTSGENNPLGSGMGLGLPLIKRVIEDIRGKITINNPPPGFSTLFKVQFPRTTRYGNN